MGRCCWLTRPTARPGSKLCRLLTLGKARAGKGGCDLEWQDLLDGGEGLIFILVPDEPDEQLAEWLQLLAEVAPGRAYLAGQVRFRHGDAVRLYRVQEMGEAAGIPLIATGDILYHRTERRRLQDVMTCIREGCTIDEAGFRLEWHAERFLNRPERMAVLFEHYPEAIARTMELVERCKFDLGDLAYQYPAESDDPAETAQDTLERLTWAGAAVRYPEGVPEAVTAQLRHELRLIGQLDYAPYFLTVNSIVRESRRRGILCQGRGSAANSAVCWVLGITSIDPTAAGLLFERFVSAERQEPPDIDVDFEHERREDIIQWVYEHYGRRRGGAVCDRDPLPGAGCDPRGGQGDGADGGHHRGAEQPGLGLERGRGGGEARSGAKLGYRKPAAAAGDRAGAGVDRVSPASRAASGRVRADPGAVERPGADRAGDDAEPADHRVGTRTTSTRCGS